MDYLAIHPQMGRSWEGAVIEELIRGLHATGEGFDCYYYRTGDGAEVDLIIEGAFGCVPFAIKYTQTVGAGRLHALKYFVREQNCPFGRQEGSHLTDKLLATA